jgi:hypothetical protein
MFISSLSDYRCVIHHLKIGGGGGAEACRLGGGTGDNEFRMGHTELD